MLRKPWSGQQVHPSHLLPQIMFSLFSMKLLGGCLDDTRVTFILEQLSLFHLQLFLCICLPDIQTKFFSHTSHCSFHSGWMKFLVLVRNFIVVSCKLKKNLKLVPYWKLQMVVSGASGACECELAWKSRVRKWRYAEPFDFMRMHP